MTSTAHHMSSSSAPSQVWLARAGARGEDEAVALELGLAIIGFSDIPELTGITDKDCVLERVRSANPGAKEARTRNRTAQLNAFVLRMQDGDIVVLPLKTRPGQVALGRVDGPYLYQSIDGVMRHTRPVKWIRPDVPRSEFEQDLLYSIGAFLTVCRIERNDADSRVAAILTGSRDPGSDASADVLETVESDDEFEEDGRATLDIAQIALDQILDHIRSRFTGHEFARLVNAVLQAEGYFTLLSQGQPGLTEGWTYWLGEARSDLRALSSAFRSRHRQAPSMSRFFAA